MNDDMHDARGPQRRHWRPVPFELSEEEVEVLFEALRSNPDRRAALRGETIARLMLECGLRVEEVRSLRWYDIEVDGLHVATQATGKPRVARSSPLSAELAALLRALRRVEAAGRDVAPDRWVLPGRNGGPITRDVVDSIMKPALRATATSIGRPISLHTLRRAFVAQRLRHSISVREVAQILGHVSPGELKRRLHGE